MFEKYPVAQLCHKEIMDMFGTDTAFDDGITVSSWIYFNFPVEKSGETIAALAFKDLPPSIATEISPFVIEMLGSRLGLYEILRNKQETCQVKELITGKEFILHQSFGNIDPGSIVLVRIFNLAGKNYIFGHSHEWQADQKLTIQGMIENKSSLYFPNKDAIVSYGCKFFSS